MTLMSFCEQINMTRQGFQAAIENETVSARVIRKMSEILDKPVNFFFENSVKSYDPLVSSTGTSEPKTSYSKQEYPELLRTVDRLSKMLGKRDAEIEELRNELMSLKKGSKEIQ